MIFIMYILDMFLKFTAFGRDDAVEYKEEKPITVKLKLEHKVPASI